MLSRIRHYTIGLLVQREHTKFELQRKLVVKGIALETTTKIVQDLEQQNYKAINVLLRVILQCVVSVVLGQYILRWNYASAELIKN